MYNYEEEPPINFFTHHNTHNSAIVQHRTTSTSEESSENMPNQPSTDALLEAVNVNYNVRAALTEKFQETLGDIESGCSVVLGDELVHAFQISINLDHTIRELDTSTQCTGAEIDHGHHLLSLVVERNGGIFDENFGNTMRAAFNEKFQETLTAIQSGFRQILIGEEVRAFRIFIDLNFTIRSLGPSDQGSDAEIDDGYQLLSLAVQRDSRVFSDTNQHDTLSNTNQHDAGVQPGEVAEQALYTMAARLLDSLDTLKLDDLPEHDKSCPVCTEPYTLSDTPTVLGCKHVVGRACLEQWFLGCHNTCPICRAPFFFVGSFNSAW